MDPESIHGNNIESIFEEDDTYENINAPKWIDLSASEDSIDDDAWFCKPDCQHPRNVEDFSEPKNNSKVKLLRSITISEIFPLRNRNRKGFSSFSAKEICTPQSMNTSGLKLPHQFNPNSENQNPNFMAPPLIIKSKSTKVRLKPSTVKKELLNDSPATSTRNEKQSKLKNDFSTRNLFAKRKILNQITEFCSELKSFVKPKKGLSGGIDGRVSFHLKDIVRDRERVPLLEIIGEEF